MPRMTELQREGQGPATSFHLFPRLSPVIRQAVWRATWTSRDVQPRLKRDDDSLITVGANLPITSQVSRESRRETLRCYNLCLGINNYPTRVFFNFDVDTLYMPTRNRQLRNMFSAVDLARVQRISVPEFLPICILLDKDIATKEESWHDFYPVPRTVDREQLLEDFKGMFPVPEIQVVSYGDDPDLMPLRTTQCQLARHFPQLRELVLRPIVDMTIKDRVDMVINPATCALRTRLPSVLTVPRVGLENECRKSLDVYYGRIRFLHESAEPFTLYQWRTMMLSLEWAFGCDGFTPGIMHPDKTKRLHVLTLVHAVLSIALDGNNRDADQTFAEKMEQTLGVVPGEYRQLFEGIL